MRDQVELEEKFENRSPTHPYRILSRRIHPAKNKVTVFARAKGQSWLINAYKLHSNTPVVKTEYILKEISLVCFVLTIFIACGRNAEVVHAPAKYPIIVMKSISSSSRNKFKQGVESWVG